MLIQGEVVEHHGHMPDNWRKQELFCRSEGRRPVSYQTFGKNNFLNANMHCEVSKNVNLIWIWDHLPKWHLAISSAINMRMLWNETSEDNKISTTFSHYFRIQHVNILAMRLLWLDFWGSRWFCWTKRSTWGCWLVPKMNPDGHVEKFSVPMFLTLLW